MLESVIFQPVKLRAVGCSVTVRLQEDGRNDPDRIPLFNSHDQTGAVTH